MSGILYIVATPIGNLSDITFRAIETLKEVDLIACEDTRHTRILLSRYSISKPLTSYFEHNKLKKSKELIVLLKEGKAIALVSDAGTPGVSDPGYRIIKDAIDSGVEIVAIPGASAAIVALALSGMPTDRFVFEGFLPNKRAARKKRLAEFKSEKRTIIIYESPHRVLAALRDIKEVLGDIEIACVREATKKFEEVKRADASKLITHFEEKAPKGEFVLVVSLKRRKQVEGT
ncbi:MAG: 16S rRNA (cytidine(1402)-2'-O)-methyltransferase [Candidatus Omnitrophica bacterium]|nr:16S rRNA (cytidine(1402)-2'-O)-methyltransferase [Candidatus Omnitrophota bacterium]